MNSFTWKEIMRRGVHLGDFKRPHGRLFFGLNFVNFEISSSKRKVCVPRPIKKLNIHLEMLTNQAHIWISLGFKFDFCDLKTYCELCLFIFHNVRSSERESFITFKVQAIMSSKYFSVELPSFAHSYREVVKWKFLWDCCSCSNEEYHGSSRI